MNAFGKFLHTGTTFLLTLGVITAIGLLSYCGMLVIVPSIPLAATAFVLAGLVEGEVFKQNISGGIQSLRLLGKNGLSILILHTLDQELKKLKKQLSSHPILADYQTQKATLAALSHKKLSRAEHEQKKKAEERLRILQKELVTLVLKSNSDDPIFTATRKKLPNLKRKQWWIRFSVPISIIGGIGFGFATASALDIALAGLGLSAALAPLVWPLAVIACIGYTLLLYHTISDMIQNETFKRWREWVKQWFQRKITKDGKPVENIWRYRLRLLGVGLLITVTVGLGVLATLATAGTWWLAVKEGMLLLPHLSAAAAIMRGIIVPIAGTAILTFTVVNSLKSVRQIIKTIQTARPIQWAKRKITNFFQRKPGETRWHKWNPFRLLANLISAPLKGAVFLGHVIATGFIGDRTPGLNRDATIASAVVGAASDGLVDYHYVAHGEHHAHHEHCGHAHHDHDHHAHKKDDDDDHNHKHDHDDHDDDDDDDHDHDHGIIMDFVIDRVLLSPLYLLAEGWNWVGERLWPAPSAPDFTRPSTPSSTVVILNEGRLQVSTLTPPPSPEIGRGEQHTVSPTSEKGEQHDDLPSPHEVWGEGAGVRGKQEEHAAIETPAHRARPGDPSV